MLCYSASRRRASHVLLRHNISMAGKLDGCGPTEQCHGRIQIPSQSHKSSLWPTAPELHAARGSLQDGFSPLSPRRLRWCRRRKQAVGQTYPTLSFCSRRYWGALGPLAAKHKEPSSQSIYGRIRTCLGKAPAGCVLCSRQQDCLDQRSALLKGRQPCLWAVFG